MKNLKKLTAIIAATIATFVCSFSFAGCELANNIQRDCDHSFIKQRHDSSLREATCTQEGISVAYKCWKCQKYQYEYTPMLPHTFDGTDIKIETDCKYSSVHISQTCTTCNQLITNYIKTECHHWDDGKHYDAKKLTLVDIGILTQEQYDALSEAEIESWEDPYKAQLNSCEHTVYSCRICGKTKSNYNHQYAEWSREVIESMKAEAANGNCGINLTINCDTCRKEERIYFHDFSEEVEVLYSSSTHRIVRYKCKTCDECETRVIYL